MPNGGGGPPVYTGKKRVMVELKPRRPVARVS